MVDVVICEKPSRKEKTLGKIRESKGSQMSDEEEEREDLRSFDPKKDEHFRDRSISSLREEYIRLRSQKDEIKELKKINESGLARVERALVDAMSEADLTSQKFKNGSTFTVANRLRFSLTLDSTQRVLEWFESEGYAPEDLVRQQLIPKRVREIVRDIYEKKGKPHIPECLKLDDTPGITVTNWDAAKAAPSAPED